MRPLLALCTLTIGLALAATAPGTAAAAVVTGLAMNVPTVTNPPAVDGTLGPAWQQGIKVDLGYDRQTKAASSERTTAYLLTDGKALYVAFDAVQTRTAIVTNEHTNMVGVDTDDEVKVALWPSGGSGLNYQFIATPIGVRYQYSSENLVYEPTWAAIGNVHTGGYVVTMRIPLSIMRGAKQSEWLINLTRWEPTTGSLYAWSGGATFQGTTDTNYARPLTGMPVLAAQKPQPRAGVYALGELASPSIGGSTSRAGADLAIPITAGTSFLAALHPDVSNVEQDQQSIAPTAFRRFINETRPMFTQGANFYNNFECDACPNELSLYTPNIPTPRNGYAVEGHEGQFSFGAFDAVGVDRNDAAQSVVYRTKPRNLFYELQRVAVNGTPADNNSIFTNVHDYTTQFSTKLDDLKHKFVYANFADETGSLVTDPNLAKFKEIGGGWYGPTWFCGGGVRSLGAQYNPYDGFVSNNNIGGYGVFCQNTWLPTHGKLKSFNVNGFIDRYHGANLPQNPGYTGPEISGLDQTDSNFAIDLVTRSLWEFQANVGSSYLYTNVSATPIVQYLMAPVTQESTTLIYRSGTSTPTTYTFQQGNYGNGRLISYFRNTTFKVGTRGAFTLEADDTRQYLPTGPVIQWLERASFAYQTNANDSVAVGVRRIIGTPPFPNGGNNICTTNTLICTNLSFAYHKRLPHDELYVIYGDASQLTTTPQFIIKLIHYVGGEKGT
ncbi:MAG: hypothetical protein JOZ38_03870 [Candidatus Eremiobacteraeota bacterium]|nr:hypothetical protein [Candidatus Eremiobacteraeota bacterium]